MNKKKFVFWLPMLAVFGLLVVFLAGCATASSPFGFWSSPGWARWADSAKPADPSQVAAVGINGPNGPYAAAYGLAGISDEAARKDAKEAIISANENTYGGYGSGYSGRGSYGFGYGGRGNFADWQEGAITNQTDDSCEVFVDGRSIGVLKPVGPGVGSESYRFLRLTGEQNHHLRAVNRRGEVVFETDYYIDGKRQDKRFTYPAGGRIIKVDWYVNIQ
ncbi:MAG: hypothetical protein AAB358_00380 [Patescibacteria group bacterium]